VGSDGVAVVHCTNVAALSSCPKGGMARKSHPGKGVVEKSSVGGKVHLGEVAVEKSSVAGKENNSATGKVPGSI